MMGSHQVEGTQLCAEACHDASRQIMTVRNQPEAVSDLARLIVRTWPTAGIDDQIGSTRFLP